jgi:hypothetical protein
VAGILNLLFRVLNNACRSRHDLLLENLVLRRQLDLLSRAKPKPRLRNADRLLYGSGSGVFGSGRVEVGAQVALPSSPGASRSRTLGGFVHGFKDERNPIDCPISN